MKKHVEEVKAKIGAEYGRVSDRVEKEVDRVVGRLYPLKVIVISVAGALLAGVVIGASVFMC